MATSGEMHGEERGGRRSEPFLVPLDGPAEVVRGLVEPMLESWGMELVQIHVVRGANRTTVRLFIDKKGASASQPGSGIGIDELEKANRMLGDSLDVEDAHRGLFRGAWDLEVSSPGVDRPLTKKSHFDKAKGERVKVRTRASVDGARVHAGSLAATSDDGISLDRDDGRSVLVPWSEILSAHIVFQFTQAKRPAPKRKKKSQRDQDQE